MHIYDMAKVISLSDRAYKKLKKIKGNMSFSETIGILLENNKMLLIKKYSGIGWEEDNSNRKHLRRMYKEWGENLSA